MPGSRRRTMRHFTIHKNIFWKIDFQKENTKNYRGYASVAHFLFTTCATLSNYQWYLEGRANTIKIKLKTVPQKMAPPRRLTPTPLRKATVAKNKNIECFSRSWRCCTLWNTKKNPGRFCTKSSVLTYYFIIFKSAKTVFFTATDIWRKKTLSLWPP